jgi:nitric oxide reductase large subunit
MPRSQSHANATTGLASGTQSAASSGFLKSYGNYVGGFFSTVWIGFAVYSSMLIYKLDPNQVKFNKQYLWAIPSALILFVGIANGYYFSKTNTDPETEKSVKSNYANITLIPIYLTILVIGIFSLIHMK